MKPNKLCILTAPLLVSRAMAGVPQYDHVVVVVEENHSYDQITSTYASSAPYINNTLIAQGANFTKFYGEEHHSEGNYLWMFAGSNFDIGFGDPVPVGPFSAPNLGSELIGANYSFKGYSESLPSIGSTVNSSGAYARKHNPWVNFTNVPNGTTVATSSNLRFTDFPSDFTQLPSVSIVVPNQNNDMHNGSDPATVATGDSWISSNLGAYYTWAKTHNSLLIVTFDEDQGGQEGLTDPATGDNQIVTVVAGAGIAHGNYAEGAGVNHVNLLRILEDMYGLAHAGGQTSLATSAGLSNSSVSDFFVQWKNDADGIWSTGSDWVGNASPASSDAVANLLGAITATRTITVVATPSVNVLDIDNAHSYVIDGPGTIIFSAAADGYSKLRVVNGAHTISAGVQLTKPTTLDIATGASLLATRFDANNQNLTKAGGGMIEIDKIRPGNVTINGGTVAISANGSPSNFSRVAALAIAGGSTPTAALDVRDNDLIVTSGTYANLAASIAYARHSGAWNRAGLKSSITTSETTLGLMTGAEFHHFHGNGATFDGQVVANSDLLVKFTYYGDTDFNGKVDGADYAHIDVTFGLESSQGNIGGWANGDFDYNNKVDGGDYGLMDFAFANQSGTLARALAFLDGTDPDPTDMTDPSLQLVMRHLDDFGSTYASTFLTAVPEPSLAGVVVSAATCLVLKRNRRQVNLRN